MFNTGAILFYKTLGCIKEPVFKTHLLGKNFKRLNITFRVTLKFLFSYNLLIYVTSRRLRHQKPSLFLSYLINITEFVQNFISNLFSCEIKLENNGSNKLMTFK